MKANRTHNAPPVIEDLGDGTFYYNFDIVSSLIENEGTESTYQETSYDYHQVRCDFPVEKQKIQDCLDQEGYNHQAEISGYEEV